MAPDEQAVDTVKLTPRAPKRMPIRLAGAFGIIFGTVAGLMRRQPLRKYTS